MLSYIIVAGLIRPHRSMHRMVRKRAFVPTGFRPEFGVAVLIMLISWTCCSGPCISPSPKRFIYYRCSLLWLKKQCRSRNIMIRASVRTCKKTKTLGSTISNPRRLTPRCILKFPLSRYNLKATKSTVTVLCTTFFSVVKVSTTRVTLL